MTLGPLASLRQVCPGFWHGSIGGGWGRTGKIPSVECGAEDWVEELEGAAQVSGERIAELEGAALEAEAAALVSDARIVELAAEVEGLHAAMEHRAVIEQAKGVLMSTMHIGPDAAFAVLVAASQRENTKLFNVAQRIADAQDDPAARDPD